MEKTSEKTMVSQENKSVNHQTNQLRDFTQGTNDQTQIIPLGTHYANTKPSGEGSSARKCGREKERMTRSKVDGLSYWSEECIVGGPEGPDYKQIMMRLLKIDQNSFLLPIYHLAK